MIFALFFQVGEVLPEYPARPAFDLLGYKTHRILEDANTLIELIPDPESAPLPHPARAGQPG